MADGNFAIQELPFPPQEVVTDEELFRRVRADDVLVRRFQAAGCTCLRVRQVGKSIVFHGFSPETDARVTQTLHPHDQVGFWFRLVGELRPMAIPAQSTAYRLTAIQHLTDD